MRLLKIAVLLLVFLVAVAVSIPLLVPMDTMKGVVLAKIEAITGRTVRMGKITLSVFPSITLNAEDVKIGNPDWAGTGDMADIKQLRLGVELIPLLHKQVHIKSFTLEDPVITLIKSGDKANWQFSAAASDESALKAQDASAAKTASSEVNIAIPDSLSLKGGRLIYQDGAAATQDISDVSMDFKSSGEKEATLKGHAILNGQKGDISLTVGSPLGLSQGSASDIDLKLSFGPLDLSWKGTIAFKNSNPVLAGAVTIPKIDVAAFSEMHVAKTAPDSGSESTIASSRTQSGRWSDTPINLTGLTHAEANLTVTIGELLLPKTTFKDIAVKARLAKGALIISTNEIAAYGGTVKFALGINSANSASFAGAVNNVKAEPLLHDFASYDSLSGTLQGQVALSASGSSQRDMIANLSGKGDFEMKDGTWKGRNILAMARNIGAAFGEQSSEATVFSECSGTFTVKDGVISNKDLVLNSPQLRVGGQGTADLPNWRVQYLLNPKLVAGGEKDASGITVPIRIEGSLDNPRYHPDLQAALKENLKNSKGVANTIKTLKNNLMNGNLGGLFR